MKIARLFLLLPVIATSACAAAPPPAPAEEEGWSAFGHALTLAQVFMRIAARSENPDQAFDDVLAGRSTEANRAIAGLLEEATADMPATYRERVAAMGLRYHDANEFLDAVKRDDTLAVELFIAGRGVNLGAKDGWGRSALDIARSRGNTQIAELLARNLPAAR